MAAAVKDFLRAAGLPLTDPNLLETPERVAEAWVNEFLDGYALTAEEALGEAFPAPPDSSGELVVVTDLRFNSMCPHHLLPYEGVAHVAYVPRQQVVGFGRLSTLVDCFAHRLILQEDLAREVAGSLARVLGSPATACMGGSACTNCQAQGASKSPSTKAQRRPCPCALPCWRSVCQALPSRFWRRW